MIIHVDQVGYLPTERKLAIYTENCCNCGHTIQENAPLPSEVPAGFGLQLVDEERISTGVELTITKHGFEEAAGEVTWIIDFSKCETEGTYYLIDDKGNESYPIHIGVDVYKKAFYDMNRMFYFQRCGSELLPEHAGSFARPCCHTAEVSDYENPEHRFILNGGWHDAGDYGRYATAGAVTIGHLLYAFSMFRNNYHFDMNLPETGNGLPDILNEVRYELDWLLGMQFEDGGVSHKLTSLEHAGYVLPHEDHLPFYRLPVSSLATGDFAGAMALASRIYKEYDAAYAERLKAAALRAWDWLEAHPSLVFEPYPEVRTGGYGDRSDLDERLWACAELARLTGEERFHTELYRFSYSHINRTRFGWADVSGFAGICILFAPDGTFGEEITACFRNSFSDRGYILHHTTLENGYRLSMRANEFHWGSNNDVMNNAIVLLIAGMVTGNREYISDASEHLHYLFGRNPLDISYVSGEGANAMKDPHNRASFAMKERMTPPGFVSGGPNPRRNDEYAANVIPEGTPSLKCFVDDYRSYSTNEIAIYWNSIAVLALAYFV